MADTRQRMYWAHTSSLMAQLYNVNRVKGDPAKAEDYNPMHRKKPRKSTFSIGDAAKRMAAAHRGTQAKPNTLIGGGSTPAAPPVVP